MEIGKPISDKVISKIATVKRSICKSVNGSIHNEVWISTLDSIWISTSVLLYDSVEWSVYKRAYGNR